MYLTRASLRRDVSVNALAPLLLGLGKGLAPHPGHHLIWSLFTEGAGGQERDFLWREEGRGAYYILSRRPPRDRHGLFDVSPPKTFAPELREGDVLTFSLRANPVIRRHDPARGRSAKHDVVMDALHPIPPSARASHRLAEVRTRGLAWLGRQGGSAGFRVSEQGVRVDGYDQHRVARGGGRPPMSFSTVDFEGRLTVEAPLDFLAAIRRGFGSAKGYGCGLMLIRLAA